MTGEDLKEWERFGDDLAVGMDGLRGRGFGGGVDEGRRRERGCEGSGLSVLRWDLVEWRWNVC